MLFSVGGKRQDGVLVPLEGTSRAFFPVESDSEPSASTAAYRDSLELVVLSDSGDCPISHCDIRTVTSTLATFSSKSKRGSTYLGIEKTIGSRARTVLDVIPSEAAPHKAFVNADHRPHQIDRGQCPCYMW